LTGLDNVILTSHSVAWTSELFRDMGRTDCEGALAIWRGEVPKNVVNREVLDRRALSKSWRTTGLHSTPNLIPSSTPAGHDQLPPAIANP
jgi:hypothetical protein